MKTKLVPQNPIILRCHRVMEAFAKSDDERDFYLDKLEGFLAYVDLDKTQAELDELFKELEANKDRYIPMPKMTFYEIKKVMECFVNEKIYDIDTKEKLLDIIQSKEARENFLEFIYDHHSELEKWQQYYQERFRIRIIEWLRNNAFDFVFEEDVELTKSIVEKVKLNMFTPKVGKDIMQARKLLTTKAATYYSSEALNPRPKRGRPPKQVVKVETEPQFSQDIYVAVPKSLKPFLFTPDYHSSSMIFTFSGKFASEADLLAHRKQQLQSNLDLQTLSQKLAALKTLSSTWNRDDGEGSFSEALAGEGGIVNEEKPKPEKIQLPPQPKPIKAVPKKQVPAKPKKLPPKQPVRPLKRQPLKSQPKSVPKKPGKTGVKPPVRLVPKAKTKPAPTKLRPAPTKLRPAPTKLRPAPTKLRPLAKKGAPPPKRSPIKPAPTKLRPAPTKLRPLAKKGAPPPKRSPIKPAPKKR